MNDDARIWYIQFRHSTGDDGAVAKLFAHGRAIVCSRAALDDARMARVGALIMAMAVVEEEREGR